MKKRSPILFPLLLLGGFVLLTIVLYDPVPPESMTEGVFNDLKIRIESYVADHHQLPASLTELPPRPDHGNQLTDGWGSPIIYAPQKDGSVLLVSPGKSDGSNRRSVQFSIAKNQVESEAESLTFMHMWTAEHYLREYVRVHSHMPGSLSDLPEVRGATTAQDFSRDCWGQPIECNVDAGGLVNLTSRGKDGKSIFRKQFIITGLKPAATKTVP